MRRLTKKAPRCFQWVKTRYRGIIRKSGKEREECGISTTEGIAVAHSWI
jgi:hypothetical protein